MDRPSLRGAALAATALLLIAVGDARADTGAATAPAEVQVLEQYTSGEELSGGAAPDATATDVLTPQTGTTSIPPASAPQPLAAEPTAPAPPGTAQVLVATDPVRTVQPPSTPAPPGPPIAESGPPQPVVPIVGGPGSEGPAPQPPGHGVTSPASATPPPKSEPAGARRPASSFRPTDIGAERLLPLVDRRLGGVQAQIDAMQRRLDSGEAPATGGLARLRSSLERVAPLLVALDSRLRAAGPLDPQLRGLETRVRLRLESARSSAGELMTALRQSGVSDRELGLLIDELEGFRALAVQPSWVAGTAAAGGPPASAANGEWRALQRAAPTHTPVGQAPLADGGGSSRSHPGGDPRPPRSASFPLPLPLDSATAGSGGAVGAAGLGLLTMLSIGLAVPLLLMRVARPARRLYAAAFLTPLERPG